jgi:hypothetical protein
MTTTKAILAKGLLPALLLSAALTVPAAGVAAPSRDGKAHAAEKAKQNKNRAPAQPVYVAQRHRRWDGWNRRYNRFGGGNFRLAGTFIGQQYGCALVQDRSGQVIPLLGNPGNLRRGDRLVMTGRIQNSSVCGTAFRVFSVDQVNGRAFYNDRFDRFDDRFYDDRFDRGNRNLVSIDGRLDDSGRCPVLRGDRGEYYDVVGDLRDFRDGDHARVIGFLGVRSRCGGQAIDVQEIIN